MISTLKGNLSMLDFDLIVDPTNQQILPMQGVSAQIFHQAGNEMKKACQALNGLEVGKAKLMLLNYRVKLLFIHVDHAI